MVLHEINTDKTENYYDLGDWFKIVDKVVAPEPFKGFSEECFGEQLPLFVNDCHTLVVTAKGIFPMYKHPGYEILSNGNIVFRSFYSSNPPK